MADDKLSIDIEVNDKGASKKLDEVANRIDKTGKESKEAKKPVDDLSKSVDKLGKEARETRQEIDGLGAEVDDLGASAGKGVPAATGLGNAMGRLGRNAGMAGIQVQQFVGQVSGGVNPMVALSQQGADLGFVLGVPLVGAIVGIGASIASFMIPALFDGQEETRNLREEIDDLYDSLDKMDEPIIKFAQFDLAKQINDQAVVVDTARKAVKKYAYELNGTVTPQQRAKRTELNAILAIEEKKYQELIERLGDANKASQGFSFAAEKITDRLRDQNIELGASARALLQYQLIQAKADATQTKQALALFDSNQKLIEQEKQKKLDAIAAKKAQREKIAALVKEANADQKLRDKARAEAEKEDKRLQRLAEASSARLNKAFEQANKNFDKQAQRIREAVNPWEKYNRIIEENYHLVELGKLSITDFALMQNKLEIETIKATMALQGQDVVLKNLQTEYDKTRLAMEDVALRGLGSIEDALVDVVMGTKTAADAFKQFALSVIRDMVRMQVQASVSNTARYFTMALGGFARGGNSASGVDAQSAAAASANYGLGGGFTGVGSGNSSTMAVRSFAGGGSTGYGARSGGIDNKGGFPAILHPNETVIDHNKGQSMGANVNISLNISTGVSDTIRAELNSMLPKITEITKAAVVDAQRRGGAFAGAFGG